ncbi:MAG: error-prone polymerase [Phycisphaerales bacterium]|nr:error-prone polymerase [Phycisphaerales bacterium]
MPEKENTKLYAGAAIDPPTEVAPSSHGYAELDVTTNFSFLRGASHADELVYTAAMLGHRAMAVTDINSLAGVVRAYEAARKIKNFRLIVGARLVLEDGSPDLLVWPGDRDAYARLSRLLTLGKRRAEKGECRLTLVDVLDHAEGMLAAIAPAWPWEDDQEVCHRLREALGDRLSLAISLNHGDDDEAVLSGAVALSKRTRVPLLATNHVHYHDPARRTLQDVLTCVRHGCTIQEAGFRLFPNAERHLKSPAQMAQLFSRHRRAIDRGLEIAEQCRFTLNELKYDYPTEVVLPGRSPSDYLCELTYAGAATRYPQGVPPKVQASLEKELKFICHSKYESYFLTVHDLVHYARSKDILCQGRGSAANSAVCYCLGVTAVDPAKFQLVFERFASGERGEPPDIDIDFEHERREEVIQYVYQKYGRDRAAMTASLITYRGRSAVRDVGKALGFSQDMLDQLAGKLDWWHRGTLSPSQLREAGVNPKDHTIHHLIALTTELLGFPRHLSQHVGGMVISRQPLCDIVPIENAAMEDRTVIEWDKDDLDTLGIFKVDILALGMLTCISKGLAMINSHSPAGPRLEMHTVPQEEAGVYDMISDADTVGVFQIESRAQMSMLPRLRPRDFYDLVIEVAIVRPGPIQGDMVHPYLQRREAKRADANYQIEFPKDELRDVLAKTLGVPLFQEQAMRLAMVAAGFSGSEADALRRAMAAWKRAGGIERFHDKFVNGMTGRGYEGDFAEKCFKQICGFGEYGFPESHAASFAKLVYVSAWIKRFHPAAFAAALLNSQPMGFYAPAQLVRDAREHGVEVRPVDVNFSEWDCTLEQDARQPPTRDHKPTWGIGGPAVRLGFRQIKGMRKDKADSIVAARRENGPFASVDQLQHSAQIDTASIRRLAGADALNSIRLNRRNATWEAMALSDIPAPLFDVRSADAPPSAPALLPRMADREEVIADYATTGLSIKCHPVSFARAALNHSKIVTAAEIQNADRFPNGWAVSVAGLVLVRQRPGTASGVVFITLEDETGVVNLIVWSTIFERYRVAARHATLLQANGIVQREGQVIHILARRLIDRTPLLQGLSQSSRDFH